MNPAKRILVTGSEGQVGQTLVNAFIQRYGKDNVLSTDLKSRESVKTDKLYTQLDVLKKQDLKNIIDDFKPNQIIHLAAILSGKGEENPKLALNINETGVRNVFDLATERDISVFVPSTIAAFGPDTPKKMTPDITVANPRTIYGITKIFMELLGTYYHEKFGLDFRSLRYPGVISADPPGGGTTDWIIEMFYHAVQNKPYESFLSEDTQLPMMHIDDLVSGTTALIEAPNYLLTDRVYNISAFSVSPKQGAQAVQKVLPNFQMTYKSDFRQQIADSWPASINYIACIRDWGYRPKYKRMDEVIDPMLRDVASKLKSQ